ncbi:TPA: ABC transporter permease [Bacillus anthracis]|nr:ABC transporter permease [Bacillus anthracis]
MLNLIKISFLKEFWEIKNNKFKLVITTLFSIGILLLFYFKIVMNITDDIFGIQYITMLAFVFYLVMDSFSYTGNITINELKLGTIENLIISPYNLITIILVRLLINFIKTLVIASIIFLFLNYFSGINISFELLSCILIAFLGVLSLYGIGITIASISIFSKEIQLMSSILKMLILYLVLKVENPSVLIPFSHAKILLLDLLFNNMSVSDFSVLFLFNFILNSIIYFMLGIVVFNKIEKLALKNGAFSAT